MTQTEKPARESTRATGSVNTFQGHLNSSGDPQLGLFPTRSKSSGPRPPVFGRRNAPLAATADPVSSKLAAAEITANGMRQSRKAAVLAFLREQSAPLTSFELARAADMDRYAVARALPDLRHDRLVDQDEMRTCRVTGRQSFTWRAL
jgi:hypothetical protein